MSRINELTRQCLDAVIQLRRADPASLPAPESLQQRLRGAIEDMMRRAQVAGLGQQDAQELAYAVVALADEVVLGKSETYRQYWMSHLLQVHFFKESVAGEGFFERLQALRADPRRRELLRVYYLCLVLGFEGRYRVRGGDLELMQLIEALQGELGRDAGRDAELLSPRGERPPEPLLDVRKNAPLLGVALGALGLSLLIFMGLRLSLYLTASPLIEAMAAHPHP